MKKPGKKLWIALGIVGATLIAAAIALPVLIDVNRYRGLIEEQAEAALGREVRLGEMQLSLLPLGVRVDDLAIRGRPEEGGGDLLTARRLRVGARLMPLLSKRLEVDSIVVEAPRLSLIRSSDGRWNIQPKSTAPGEPGAETPDFHVDLLRITDGQIQLRDELGRETPLLLTLDALELELRDLDPTDPVGFEMAASWSEVPGADILLDGKLGPLVPTDGAAIDVQAHLELSELDASSLQDLLSGIYPVPPGLLGGTDLALTADVDASLGTATRVAVSDVVLDGIEVSLRRGAGGDWNLPAPSGESRDGDTPPSTSEVTLHGLQIRRARLSLEDHASDNPLSIAIDDLTVSLDGLPTQGPSTFDVSGEFADGGPLSARGQLGPISSGTTGMPLAVDVEVERVPDAVLRLANREGFRLNTDDGTVSFVARVAGQTAGRLDIDGNLEVSGLQATVSRPSVAPLQIPIDSRAEYSLAVIDSGDSVDVRRFAVDLAGSTMATRGSIRREGRLHRVDLELLPAKVPADELKDLLMLVVGALPVSFASDSPIELEGRVHGLVGEGRIPQIDGQARLRGFTFEHPALQQPLSNVGAALTVEGERLRIEEFSAAVGASDLSGDVTIEGFSTPRVEFDLHSKNADFGELFSFLSTGEPAPEGQGAAEEASPPNITLDGTIEIEQGAFDSLKFNNLAARMQWQDDVLTLAPVTMDLYDGTFDGRVASDMSGDAPTFDVRGEVRGIDIDPFLADNLGQSELLFGRFTGSIDTRTSGSDYEALIRGLEGSGAVEVKDGRIAGLDLLETLSRVSGLFGENTLGELSGRLASDGTEFVTMAGGILFEGGRMRFDDLVVESPDFKLGGNGIVNLLGASLNGDFRLGLSQQLSASMHAENSRAGQLFWDARTRSVQMPFTLEGPFTSPKPGIDWGSVADTAIRGRAEDEVRNLLAEKLGLSTGKTEPAPAPSQVQAEAKAPNTAPPGAKQRNNRQARNPSGLGARISETDWGGSFLTPDLELQGNVRGTGIDRAELSIVDARGVPIRDRDRLRDIDRFFEAENDRQGSYSIPWEYEIDGKKLLLAKFPVTVTVVVYDRGGSSKKTSVVVDR